MFSEFIGSLRDKSITEFCLRKDDLEKDINQIMSNLNDIPEVILIPEKKPEDLVDNLEAKASEK